MYILQEYVKRIMNERNMSVADVALAIGYKNVSKGSRKVSDFLNGDFTNRLIAENLKRFMQVSDEDMRHLIDDTARQMEEEKKKLFRPFLYAKTKLRIPSQIFVCAMLGSERYKVIYLPEGFSRMDYVSKAKVIKNTVRDSMQRFNGIIPTFGEILYYVLRADYDENENERVVYDCDGNPVSGDPYMDKSVSIGMSAIRMKKHDITWFFKNMIINESLNDKK